MPPVRTGSAATFTSNVNSGSTSIAVPADATALVVGVSGFGAANYFTGGGMTLNGVAASPELAFDGTTAAFMGAMFVWFNPATGTQTLAWDWLGTSAPSNGVNFVWAAYKDLDTTGLRSSSGVQAASDPFTTGTLTAQSGDLIVAVSEQYGASTIATWTNASGVLTVGAYLTAVISLAEGSPSGNTTVTCDWDQTNDGGIGAIVFKPAGDTLFAQALL